MAGALHGQSPYTEFLIPTASSSPYLIGPGPDGNLWFAEYNANKIGRITTGGILTEFLIPTANSRPLAIVAGPDGNLWFTESFSNKIGRITPAGFITEFSIPTAGSRPVGIAAGPDGKIWFTEQNANNTDKIGRISTGGTIEEFSIPGRDEPIGITTGPDGNVWFTENFSNKIGRMTTGGVLTEFPLPRSSTRPAYIRAGPDGNLWFTESVGSNIGRITPNGLVTEFQTLGDIVAGPDGALWYTENSSNRIGRITTAGAATQFGIRDADGESAIPTPASAPIGIAAGGDGNIWFTESAGNQIGRLKLTGGLCAQDATTLCLNAGRFKVQTRWFTRDGASGSGQAVPLTGDTGYFWFFSANNVEMVVKVLNACGFNARFWTFAGGLTDVNVVMTATDTQTGTVKTYTNPQGTAFQPIQDTSAFATCSVITQAGAQGLATTGGLPLPADGPVSEASVLEFVSEREQAACAPDPTTLCLNGGRFKVQTQWFTRDGASGPGQAVGLTGDTGYFWFFSSNNVEMLVKVLNACTFNARFWTFAGGLTDVNVVMTVTDTQTGTVRTYTNPQGTPFQPIQDTSAFATCP